MKLGIIGCGNMGSALAEGIVSKKVLPFNNIYISDKQAQKTKALNRKFGIRMSSNSDIVKKANVIVLAVKPQAAVEVLSSLESLIDAQKHIISVMAGISIARIETFLKKKTAVTRAMPNMAALVGKSITCISHNGHVKDKTFVQKLFSSIGEVMEIDEKHIDAVTAISGSGPAYFFYVAECLIGAAIKLGIQKDKATKLAMATLVGSGAVMDVLKLHPAILRGQVTSKRGTTEAALEVLKSKGLEKVITAAVKAAQAKSKELSRSA